MTIDNLDSLYKPVVLKGNITLANHVSATDSSLYIIPLYFNDLKENPFKTPKRNYPVDFGILPDRTLILNITLPPGTTCVSTPATVSLKIKDNAATFVYQASKIGNNVKIIGKFTINRQVFNITEYNDLQAFYNQMLKKLSEAIILKRNG